MSQIDEISRMLEESGQSTAEKRAWTARGGVFTRRRLLMGLGALVGGGTLTAAGVGAANMVARGRESITGVPVSARPAARTAAASSAPPGVDGEVVWSGAATRTVPVLAPGGVGGVIDSEGHVQILGSRKVLATSQDVTPDAVLVAGTVDGKDALAWTTGKNLSWWTQAQGIQRASHSRPLGVTAVGGGILVFDDEQWSGRITATEVAGIAAASDSITIGVRPDGASVAATSGGILTVTPPNGQLQIVQPPAPAAGAQVWRVAGLLGEYAVLVWAVAEHPELPCTVTTLSVESGQAVGSGSATSDLVEGSEFVRCGRGGAFAGLLVAPDGVLRPVPDGVVVAGSAGDVLEGARGSDKVHVDPSTGAATAAPADGLWHLTGSMTSWVKSKSTVWFVDRKKEKS